MSNCDHIRKIQNLTVLLVKRIHRLRPKHTQWIIYVLLNNRITRGLNGTKREKPRFFYSIQPKEQNTVLRAGNRIKQVPSPKTNHCILIRDFILLKQQPVIKCKFQTLAH